MNTGEIRKFRDARPFVPFTIIMVDGRRFTVPHPDFIWVPPEPRGTWVYVHDPKTGAADHVNTAVISSIQTKPRGTNGKRKAS